MATILKRPGPRGKKVWQVQIRKKGYPHQIKTFDQKTAALRWAKKTEHEMEDGSWRDSREASSTALEEALDRYLRDVTPNKRINTQRSQHLSARYLKEELGRYSLLQVTPEKVAAYRDFRLGKLAPASIRLELSLLSSVFNIAQKEWGFHGLDNPVKKISLPRIPEGRCPILSEDQILRFLGECSKSRTKLLYPFALLSLHTGCRSMELRGLRWAQVNLEEGYISLMGVETKAHRSRNIPLTQAAQSVLKDLAAQRRIKKVVTLSGNSDDLVFPSKSNHSMVIDLHSGFNRAVRRAGLDNLPGAGKLRIHDLRHLCGTFLVMNGVDLETVRSILGHRDLTTTQRYLHVVNEHKKKAIDKIGHLGIKTEANNTL